MTNNKKTFSCNRRTWLGVMTAAFAGHSLSVQGQAESTGKELKASSAGRFFETDVLVCGGGPAGFAAATMSARQGAKTILAERYGRLGGMAVHARVIPLMGRVHSPFVTEVIKKVAGVRFDPNRPDLDFIDPEKLDLQYADFIYEAGGTILLHAWALDAEVSDNQIRAVKFLTKEGIVTIFAKQVIDATGDGDVAAQAGAAFEIGRKKDALVQPMSIMFSIGGLSRQAQFGGGEEDARRRMIGNETWETVVMRGQKQGELPPNVGVVRTYRMKRDGEASVNATQINYVSGLNVEDLTRAEIEGRKQAYQIVEFMRKNFPGYENAYISNMPAVVGVRESRRVLGKQFLVRKDLETGRCWENSVVRGATFLIDIHNPAGSGQAEGHAGKFVNQGAPARDKPYDIPVGCLIARDIDGLLMAGRCISGSHEASSSYRVHNICMAIGAAAGTLAGLAVTQRKKVVDVDIRQVQKVLFES
ncbi:MAG: FAD-dependent oxidoreductase [Planctomycetaceae bacterium]|jgi:hypothetical protein|nr:FAD-dependent oxidoreductase [Planctomycetaceae bacterium]